jgi:hypothetical protein
VYKAADLIWMQQVMAWRLVSDLCYRFFTAKCGLLWTWFMPKLMMVQKAVDQVHFIVFAKLRRVSLRALVLEKSGFLKKVELYRKYF